MRVSPSAGFSQRNESKGNPAVTITDADRRPNSPRRTRAARFQVDGSLNRAIAAGRLSRKRPENCSACAVAKMGPVDTIGFVVPADELRRPWRPSRCARLGSSRPFDQKRRRPPDQGADRRPQGQGQGCPASRRAGLRRDRSAPIATDRGRLFPIPRRSSSARSQDRDGLRQRPGCPDRRGSRGPQDPDSDGAPRLQGKLVYAKPKEIDLPKKPGRILIAGEVLQMLKELERTSITMLGPLVDPDKDCKLVKDEDDLKIKIDVPGGKIRTLAPADSSVAQQEEAAAQRPDDPDRRGRRLRGDGRGHRRHGPGSKLPKDRQGNELQFTFQGGGLLLYQDKDNFVRLERTAGVSLDDLHPIHKVLFEVVKDGKHVENQVYPPVPEGTVYLVLVRRKGRVQLGSVRDLTSPPMPLQEVEVGFDQKVKIGLTASNISDKPYSATFENFAIDTTQLKPYLARTSAKATRRRRGATVESESLSVRSDLVRIRPDLVASARMRSRRPVTAADDGVLGLRTRGLRHLDPDRRDWRAAVSTRTVIECRPAASGIVNDGDLGGAAVSSIQSRTPAAESACTWTAPGRRDIDRALEIEHIAAAL